MMFWVGQATCLLMYAIGAVLELHGCYRVFTDYGLSSVQEFVLGWAVTIVAADRGLSDATRHYESAA